MIKKRHFGISRIWACQYLIFGESRILGGVLSQNDARFDRTPARFTNCLVAALYKKNPTAWQKRDIEAILTYGFMNYRTIINRDRNEISRNTGCCFDWTQGKILFHNMFENTLEKFIFSGDHRTEKTAFHFSKKIYGGPVLGQLWENDDDFYVPMETTLERTLEKTGRAIAITNEKWFCFMRSSSEPGILFFNSHPVNIHNETKFNGVARVWWCHTIKELVAIYSFAMKRDTAYQVFGVELGVSRQQISFCFFRKILRMPENLHCWSNHFFTKNIVIKI